MKTSIIAMSCGVSALALAASLTWATSAVAATATATADAGGGPQLDEVVVTARRASENVINVPIAIESYSAVELKRSGATGLRDLASMTPGLTFQDVNGAFASPVIRGMEQVDQTSLQGNVGVFVDGVYLNNRSGLEFGLLEMDRIEVDKGPQSALYGRNTFSGAINYITTAPTLGQVKGNASAEVGNYNRQTYTGGVNVPIGEIAALRLFGGWSKFDGTIKNDRTGDDIGGYKSKEAYGASLLIQPTDKLSIRLYAAESKMEQNATPLYAVPIALNNCGATSVRPNGVFRTLFCGATPKVTSVNVNDTIGMGTAGETKLYYVNVDYTLPFAVLTGTVSDEKANYQNLIDTTALPAAISTPATAFPGFSSQNYINSVTPNSTDTSIDVRLASLPDSRLRWLGGLYGYDSDLSNITQISHQLLNQPNSAPVPFSSSGGRLKSQGRSIYGLIGYDFTDKLSVTAETRYTREKQQFQGTGSFVTVTINGVVTPVRGNQSFKFWAPRFTANYKFTPDLVGYISAAKGVKTGGFNSNGFTLGQYFAFKPETNWSYEAGVKTLFMDNRIRVNADVFFVDWSNIQGQRYSPGTITSIVTNLGGATSKGIEATAEFAVTNTLTLRASTSYADPKYKSGFIDGDVSAACGDFNGTTAILITCSDNVGGNQMARTSKYQTSVSADWTVPNILPGVDGFVRGDYSFQSGKFTDGLENNSQGHINLVNARVGVTRGPLEFAIWSKNLLDSSYVDRVTITSSTADGAPTSGITYIRVYPGERRTFGARLDYHF